ncbi:MAG: hypothetical protein U9Q67_02450 [Patescibacteria group bacterium]|nr:hypothetical protein [Patescibacteria group bacterium]
MTKTLTKVSTKVVVGFAIGAIMGAGAFFFVNMAQEDVIDEVVSQQLNPIKLEKSETEIVFPYSEEEIENIKATWTEEDTGFYISPDRDRLYFTPEIANQIEMVGTDTIVYKSAFGSDKYRAVCFCDNWSGGCSWGAGCGGASCGTGGTCIARIFELPDPDDE